MKNIRIQNDIVIKWRIYRLGEEYNLEGKSIVVKLFDSVGKPAPITIQEIDGNEISILFEGRNQSKLGAYTLFLQENTGEKNMCTIDKTEAFNLVRHSEQEGGCVHDPMVSVESLSFETDIDVPSSSPCDFTINENGILTVKSTGKQYNLNGGGYDVPEGETPEETPSLDSNKEVQDFLEGFDNTQKLKDIIEDNKEPLSDDEMSNLINLFPTS